MNIKYFQDYISKLDTTHYSDSTFTLISDELMKDLVEYRTIRYFEFKDEFVKHIEYSNLEIQSTTKYLRNCIINAISRGVEDFESDWEFEFLAAYELYIDAKWWCDYESGRTDISYL